jgi:hypothetical protein
MFRGREVMSALGQKQPFAVQNWMSALPPKADICSALADVRFVPEADMRQLLLDHLVGLGKYQARNFNTLCFCCF